MSRKALEDITIADFGQSWAGPHASRLLADMGARVIKIESMKRIDVIRGLSPWVAGQEPTLNNSGYYNWLNRNKLGVTIDVTKPKGQDLAKKIIKMSDVMVENFSRGVMGRLGLDYESVKQVNPAIIYAALSGMGEDGPFRDLAMYGRPQMYMSGISYISGYPEMAPHSTNTSWGDPVGGNHASVAILSAPHSRKRTGLGKFIELSQWEGLISISPENIMEHTLNNRVRERQGNRDEFMAPHNVYRCSGGDLKWVSIAVADDEEWKALCKVMGDPEWARAEEFSNALGRWQNQDEMDRHIEAWTKEYTPYEVTKMLQKAGVAAFPCLSNRGLVEDPHLNDREFFEEYDHPEVGRRKYGGFLWKMSKTPCKIRCRAPMVGEHNNYVFGELLGFSQENIDLLIKEKVLA